jgi:hypothetical protein
MTWLTIFIFLGVLSLIIGPVMLMQPTPTQRREANLRNKALEQGLRVQLLPLPTGMVNRTSKTGVCYSLAWPSAKSMPLTCSLIRKRFEHDLHVYGVWDWYIKPDNEELVDLLSRLTKVPDKVYAITCTPQNLGCYWSEIGQDDDVEDIANWLNKSIELWSRSEIIEPA